MERRMALATATAVTATLGVGTISFAAVGGAHLLGFGGKPLGAMVPITEVETVTRVVVVHSADGSVVTDPAGAPVTVLRQVTISRVVPATPATRAAAATAAPTAAPAAGPTTGTSPAPSSSTSTTTSTTVRPATTTTTIRVRSTTTTVKSTSSTLPPGVPADWPVGTPIPPMPANCEQPQLELNGVWNCG